MKKINYRHYVPVGLFLILLVLSFFIVKPFLLSIFLGALLAYIFYPLYKYGVGKLKNKTLVALLVCLLVLVIIIIPAFFFAKSLVGESYSLYVLGKQKLSMGLFEDCSNSLCRVIHDWGQDPQVKYQFQEGLKAVTNWIIKKGSDFLVAIPQLLVSLFVMFFTLYYFLKDGKALVGRVSVYLSMQKKKYLELMERLKEIVKAIVYGYLLVALLQGALGAAGFWLFGVNSPLFWGAIMAFLALIPYLGTGLVWGPAALIMILDGVFGNSNLLIYKGVGLFVYGLLIVGSLDNLIRPRIISKRAKIHPALILIGTLGGIWLIGLWGIIIGPLILSMTAVVMEEYLYKKKN